MNALLNKDFLKELDNFNNREIYARITVLDINENPLELIEGKITGGSINIDGASALRRTCSVSMIAEDVNINEFYWGLNNKFKLEIGLKNFVNSNYPDIIWFPQGIYIITSFNCNLTVNNFTISINGKDKMCRLNGEFGGSLPASIDFGVEDYYDFETGIITQTKIPIKKIIREMIHTYAEEPYHNIIINDLDDHGLELLEYRGSSPLYLLYDIGIGEYTQMSFNGKQTYYDVVTGEEITLDSIPNYNKRIDALLGDNNATIIESTNADRYTVSKIEYGQTAGYRLTELIYAGDLISGIGESITSILDKIVNMLGNFEYFYDLSGKFIFQQKKTYLNVSWNSIINSEDDLYIENSAYAEKSTYRFDENNLIKSLSNTPDLTNVKNDYIIWGNRKSASGAEIPIHMRYAIHKKPTKYTRWDGEEYTTDNYDWRELIYQMALDYYKHNQEEDYLITVAKNNPEDYPTGITGYETFYIDFQAFWRELYNPDQEEGEYQFYSYDYDDNKISSNEKLYVKEYYDIINSNDINQNDKKKVLVYDNGKFIDLIDTIPVVWEDKKYYVLSNGVYMSVSENLLKSIDKKTLYIKNEKGDYIHLIETAVDNGNWYIKKTSNTPILINGMKDILQKIYKDNNGYNKYYIVSKNGIENKAYINYYYKIENYYHDNYPEEKEELNHWNKNVYESPDLINFWIDFLDDDEYSELSKMSIFTIGNRPKVVNDKNVKSIYYRDVPNVIYGKREDITSDIIKEKTGYIFMNLTDGIFNSDCFNISSQGKSAKDSINELIYQHSYCTESINLQSVPIYYLEPNTIISIEDKNTKINGEYILNKITIPLAYNGMMSIQATKSPQKIY